MTLHDLKLQTGRANLPAVLLIHGLGMNRHYWGSPDKCHAFGGLTPLTVFLAGPPPDGNRARIAMGRAPTHTEGLAGRLRAAGYSTAAWTQQAPLGPVMAAVSELGDAHRAVMEKWPGKPLYLIGHSRGGLIAKKYLLDHGMDGIDGLISLGSPFAGTRLAAFADLLRPVGGMLGKLIPPEGQGKVQAALTRMAQFLTSRAIDELGPDAEFISALQRELPARFRALSVGGTDPTLFRIYLRSNGNGKWRVLTFPDFLLRFFPGNHLPEEITPGKGDALVTAASAVLRPGSHRDFPVNHVGLAFDREIQATILQTLTDWSAGNGRAL